MYDEYENNKCNPLDLDIDFSGRTYRFVGDNGQMFFRLISNLVGSKVPLHYHTWRRVPTKYKADLYPKLEVNIQYILYVLNFTLIKYFFTNQICFSFCRLILILIGIGAQTCGNPFGGVSKQICKELIESASIR